MRFFSLSTPLLACLLPLVTSKGLFESTDATISIQRSSLDRRVVASVNADICENLSLVVPFTTVQTCVSNTEVDVKVGTANVVAVAAKAAVCTSVVSINVASGTSACVTANVATKVNVAGLGPTTVQVPTTTCTTITENDITVSAGVCLCVSGGVLTNATLDTISGAVNASTAISTAIANANANAGVSLTTAAVTNYLNSVELNILVSDGQANKCNYPQGAIPNCNGVCTYTCPTGYSNCNGICSTSCVSGVASRRRSYTQGALDFRCPKGYDACATTALHLMPSNTGPSYECVDTDTDIESCGGCAFPLDLQASHGQDCTAIPNSMGVRCQRGKCIVETCEKYFEVSPEGDACVAKTLKNRSRLQGYMV